MKLFNLDSPFQRYGTIAFDLLALNLIWLFLSLFSIGILMGPATIALYYAVYQSVITGESYPFRSFWKALKNRFFFKLGFSILYYMLTALSLFNIYLTLSGQFGTIWILPLYFFIFLELTLFGSVAFPLLAQNHNLKFTDFLKISFIIANKHLPWIFLATLLNIGLAFILFININGLIQFSFLLFFVPVLIIYAAAKLVTQKVLSQYQFFENYDGNIK